MSSIHRLKDELHRVERAALYCSDARTKSDLGAYLSDLQCEIDRQSHRDRRSHIRADQGGMNSAFAL